SSTASTRRAWTRGCCATCPHRWKIRYHDPALSDIPCTLSRWDPSRAVKVAFLAFAALCVVGLFAAKIWSATVSEGKRLEESLAVDPRHDAAPAVALKDHDGKEFSLASLRGKPVFPNFWATW